jgi:glycosylphosphatidylinositol transamidase
MNNLLERLHASFFFYILTTAQSFVKIGGYLPAAVIMSVAMTFGGLALWVEAGWLQVQNVVIEEDKKSDGDSDDCIEPPKQWVKRSRPVVDAFVLMGCTHLLGAVMLFVLSTKVAVNTLTVSCALVNSDSSLNLSIQELSHRIFKHTFSYNSARSLCCYPDPTPECTMFRKDRTSLDRPEILYSLSWGNNNGIAILTQL